MEFKDMLKEVVVRVDGATAAIIMGYDGIALEEYRKEGVDTDIQLIGIEYSSILKEMKRASEILECGEVAEVSILTKKGMVVVRGVTDEYFLMVSLTADGNLGKARYLMKMASPKLKELL